jgi:predicted nuclease of restriction endonuclease-like (RecB) superfamily
MQLQTKKYNDFLSEVKDLIRKAQYTALKAVNKQQIQLYRNIGKRIVEKQEQLGWGKSIVEQLSKDLQAEYPGQRGWSTRNLWLMKQFYEVYQNNQFLQPLAAEIGWTHNVLIMSKCKDDLQREHFPLQ